jgi:hypothetical protein
MASGGGTGFGPLSIDFGILDFTWRSIVLVIGMILIIPAPWVFVWYTQWIVSCVRVPGRPNLSFTGNAMTLVPWWFGFVVLAVVVEMSDIQSLNNLIPLAQIVLSWLLIKWMVANVASNGQPLGLSFVGSIWAYFGWNILLVLSFITIIGWAWVVTAMLRWSCRNVSGSRREIQFNGSGLDVLWRSLVFALASFFIIPIPWMLRWYANWYVSQFAVAPRGGAYA